MNIVAFLVGVLVGVAAGFTIMAAASVAGSASQAEHFQEVLSARCEQCPKKANKSAPAEVIPLPMPGKDRYGRIKGWRVK